MSKLGEFLKSEREKKGLSLHEIGMSLKINPKILKAIEDGDEANLPAKTFLRGFVKSYAQYLRSDINEALHLFQEEFGSTRPPEPKKTLPAGPATNIEAPATSPAKSEGSLRRTEDSALPSSSSNKLFSILGAVILLVLIAFVIKMMDKYQKESRVTPADTIAAVEGDKSAELKVLGSPEEATIGELPLASPISGAEPGSSSTTLATATAVVPVMITTTTATTLVPATSTTTKTTTTTMKPVMTTSTTIKMPTTMKPAPANPETDTSSTTSTLPKGKGVEVIVEALSNVSVKFTRSNGSTEVFELSPDQFHTFRSRTSIQLEISDGGAVNIIVDGRDKGVPGTIGKPLKVTYP